MQRDKNIRKEIPGFFNLKVSLFNKFNFQNINYDLLNISSCVLFFVFLSVTISIKKSIILNNIFQASHQRIFKEFNPLPVMFLPAQGVYTILKRCNPRIGKFCIFSINQREYKF